MENLQIRCLSDTGLVRTENEDSHWSQNFSDMAVLVVADGMGGQLGGREASQIVVETCRELFDQNRTRLEPDELLNDCLELANRKIHDISQTEFQGRPVGSTCTLALVKEKMEQLRGAEEKALEVFCAHVGDSRLYHLQGSKISQITTDHTMLQKLLDANALSAAEADNYAHKNIIYKSLNGDEKLEFDPIIRFDFLWGDALLICSDGLFNYLGDDEFSEILEGTQSLGDAADYLVNLAKFRGGDDNITVCLLEYGKFPRQKSVKLKKIRKIRRAGGKKKKIAVLLVLFILLAAASGLLWITLKNESERIRGNEIETNSSQPKDKTELDDSHQKGQKIRGAIDDKQGDPSTFGNPSFSGEG